MADGPDSKAGGLVARWLDSIRSELPRPPAPTAAPGASAPSAATRRRPWLPPQGMVRPGDLRGDPKSSRWRRPLFRLALTGIAGSVVAVFVLLIWLITGLGNFWPVWVWFGCAVTLATHFVVERTLATEGRAGRAYVVHEGITFGVGGMLLAIWAIDNSETFWPGWVLFNFGLALAIHYVIRAQAPMYRAEQLMDRVDQLTTSRSGALDVQAAELRRIERDLHDGAQARLVALSMQLGRAEARLGDDVDAETKALIKGAQEDARLAIAELRDLARGIAPPVLTDRGLAAAVEALGKRSALEVEVTAHVEQRYLPVVESAAYFVVAEALTNAAKHSPGCSVNVTIAGTGQRLQVVIADDGQGGADPDGGGLTGLRQRVGALDGAFTVVSPRGHGTTITAELPTA